MRHRFHLPVTTERILQLIIALLLGVEVLWTARQVQSGATGSTNSAAKERADAEPDHIYKVDAAPDKAV